MASIGVAHAYFWASTVAGGPEPGPEIQNIGVFLIPREGGASIGGGGGGVRTWKPKQWWEKTHTISHASAMEERRRSQQHEANMSKQWEKANALREHKLEPPPPTPEEPFLKDVRQKHEWELAERDGRLKELLTSTPSAMLSEEMRKRQAELDEKKLERRIRMAKLRARKRK